MRDSLATYFVFSCTALYLAAAVGYAVERRWGLAVQYSCYGLANVGVMAIGWRWTGWN